MKKIYVAVALLFLLVPAGYFAYAGLGIGKSSTAQSVAKSFAAKYDIPVERVIVDVDGDTGYHARGSIQFEGQFGGGLWFAANTSKGWEIAFDGNGIIPCSAADAYDFPATMIPQCIDTEHDNALVQR